MTSLYPQGIYLLFGCVVYIAFEPANENYMLKLLIAGTTIKGYSSMYTISKYLVRSATLLIPGWLPNDAVPSDLYPELFI